MVNNAEIRKTIEDLKQIVERNLPEDDRGVLRGVIESLEEYLKMPYDEEASPFQQKKHHPTVYKKRVGK